MTARAIACAFHRSAQIVSGNLKTKLFEALLAAARQCMQDFNPQHLANTAWALAVATVGHKDEQLFTALVNKSVKTPTPG